MDLGQGLTQEKGQMEPTLSMGKIDAHTDVMCMKLMKMSVMMTAQWRTLSEQVQSLFYS